MSSQNRSQSDVSATTHQLAHEASLNLLATDLPTLRQKSI
jgi:hypothetical protein